VLTGAPSARKVFRDIAAQPGSAVRLDVVGPGGSGKTTLLELLAEMYRQATVTVIRRVDDLPAGEEIPDAAVLVDDAHLLTDDELGRLQQLAAAGRPRLVVAHRPWPTTAAMSRLGSALTRHRPPLVLGPLDRPGVASRMALMFGARPTNELVERITERTAGMPSLVDRLLRALRTSGAVEVTSGPEPRLQVAMDIPPGLLEQIRYDLADLPKPVRRMLLAVAVGAPVDADVLAPTLNLPPDEVSDLVEAGRAAGLLGADGALAPLVRMALVQHTAELQVQSVRQRLAEVQLERGGNPLVVARGLLGTGASGDRIAALYVTAGDEALRGGDPLARDYYAAAVEAGAAPAPLAARRAHAAAAVGDFDDALRLADAALADPSAAPPDRPRAVAVAATVAAQRGMLARTAQLYRWLASVSSPPTIAAAAVPALLGMGALHEAREVLSDSGGAGMAAPPTVLYGAEMLVARGLLETIGGSATAGLSQLARASALVEPAGPSVLLPDTPSALAALVAVQCGELDVAQSVLDRGVAARLGGPARGSSGTRSSSTCYLPWASW
jgi:energy-coupling factor transporter ATP-binding protein EcfA2